MHNLFELACFLALLGLGATFIAIPMIGNWRPRDAWGFLVLAGVAWTMANYVLMVGL